MRKAFGYFFGSIRLSVTQGWMLGILLRAMMAVTARDSPELVGPQIASTFNWLISSCVAFTALVGSPCVSRVIISIWRPFTPPAALISLAANTTPRLNPIAGAALAPVSDASQPMRIGAVWAMAGLAKRNSDVPRAELAIAPSPTDRRVSFMPSSLWIFVPAD